jgi:hypothetical protein
MADRRGSTDREGEASVPHEFAESTPRDLYATSDIRFVMLKLGELMTKVDQVLVSVDKQGEKIDALQHKVSFVKGAMWVLGGLLGVLVLIAGWYFSGRLSITVSP